MLSDDKFTRLLSGQKYYSNKTVYKIQATHYILSRLHHTLPYFIRGISVIKQIAIAEHGH